MSPWIRKVAVITMVGSYSVQCVPWIDAGGPEIRVIFELAHQQIAILPPAGLCIFRRDCRTKAKAPTA